ncbi:MAG: branched-chain amino acid transport system permease protein [Pseudomonadota bacterium]|nr:branched-chain amino acid transport system permease protein [Pseudomonadota bacterium]
MSGVGGVGALYRQSARRRWLALGVGVLLALLPPVLQAFGQEFYISFAARVLIFALAATSLNFVVGFGGMVAFGHAAFFGAGAYTVAILMELGVASAFVAWPIAVVVSAVLALGIGLISLRTRGVYFIMITLAFAQMIYYLCISMKLWGGDDGLSLPGRSGFGPLDLKNDAVFYWVVLGCLAASLYLLDRITHARFGRVLQAIRENESRMEGLGYPVLGYKLLCIVIGAALAGLAGALIANHGQLASPNLLQWTQSGTLLVMVIVGGVGALYGGAVGAVALLLVEEVLASYTSHWHAAVGLILLLVVFWAPKGIAAWVHGLFSKGGARE